MSQRDIKQTMEAHVDELMSVPGVVGVAIGQLDTGVPCIQVLVDKMTDELERRIPGRIEGHPVVVEVTGTIRGMGDAEDR